MSDKNNNKPGGEKEEPETLCGIDAAADTGLDGESQATPETKEKIAELNILSGALNKEKDKAENYYNQLVALKAEFENYRKRSERESAQMASYGKKTAIKEFLPVMDNMLRFEEAVKGGDFHSPMAEEGMKIIIKELKKIFAALGVKQMDCVGKEFSPHIHEAVFKEQTNEFKDGSIIKIVSNGYYLGQEMLKPAMVVIAENTSEKKDETIMKESNDKDVE
ncbi:nucleotide exchange factor GrpE [bacterium]|nr:nucleotide exchange factor GrpE [bacterium]MBU3955049.1 nucleotide exchange factor GrpE [bacterium]MBU4134018.1 nucleotide exchange factor GrpE [bacterium]